MSIKNRIAAAMVVAASAIMAIACGPSSPGDIFRGEGTRCVCTWGDGNTVSKTAGWFTPAEVAEIKSSGLSTEDFFRAWCAEEFGEDKVMGVMCSPGQAGLIECLSVDAPCVEGGGPEGAGGGPTTSPPDPGLTPEE